MKKIILFTDSLVRGGAQRQLVELAAHLNRERFEVKIVIYHDIQQLRIDADNAGVPVVLIEKKSKLDFRFFWRLFLFFRSERPDIIQSYLNTANLWARLAGTLAGVKRIITSERNIDLRHSRFRLLLEWLLHPLSDIIVVNAAAIKNILIDSVKVPSAKIRIIYNGVNMERFKNASSAAVTAFREQYALLPDNFVLVLPGRLQSQKNHLCLIKAVEEAGDHAKNWRIVFVGNENDLSLKQQLQERIVASGLADSFVFAGKQDDMEVVYSVADMVVLPSLWEGFPNVLLEAMCMGKVVVASDIADNTRIVTNGINGFLFQTDNHQELSACLVKLYQMSSQERLLMGEAGRQMVTERFTIEKMVSGYEEIYAA